MIDKHNKQLKVTFFVFLILILSVVGITFGIAFINDITFYKNSNNTSFLQVIFAIIMSVVTIACLLFLFLKKDFLYKSSLLIIVLASIISVCAFLLFEIGFFEKIKSVEDLRLYVASFGKFTWAVFVIIQFLQVAILPIPGFITVGAGVLLFGPLKGAILSCIGIILGSLCAFFIGRKFGYKVICWLAGKESVDKAINVLKGKDKILLTFMFLFPFFPDDVLCFVAGISAMSWKFFIIMMVITRIISIFTSSFSLNNSLIPFNTWWGILIWIIFFLITFIFAFLICNKGDKIQGFFKGKSKNDK